LFGRLVEFLKAFLWSLILYFLILPEFCLLITARRVNRVCVCVSVCVCGDYQWESGLSLNETLRTKAFLHNITTQSQVLLCLL
jgi:hypothetical protein